MYIIMNTQKSLDYDFDLKLENCRKKCDKYEIDIKTLDYMIGDDNSLRYEYIKSIKDTNEKLNEMSLFLREIIDFPFPDEFYDWYARDILDMKYTKYEIKDMKRKYKIKVKRELEKKKILNKKKRQFDNNQKKKPKFIKEKKTIEF